MNPGNEWRWKVKRKSFSSTRLNCVWIVQLFFPSISLPSDELKCIESGKVFLSLSPSHAKTSSDIIHSRILQLRVVIHCKFLSCQVAAAAVLSRTESDEMSQKSNETEAGEDVIMNDRTSSRNLSAAAAISYLINFTKLSICVYSFCTGANVRQKSENVLLHAKNRSFFFSFIYVLVASKSNQTCM